MSFASFHHSFTGNCVDGAHFISLILFRVYPNPIYVPSVWKSNIVNGWKWCGTVVIKYWYWVCVYPANGKKNTHTHTTCYYKGSRLDGTVCAVIRTRETWKRIMFSFYDCSLPTMQLWFQHKWAGIWEVLVRPRPQDCNKGCKNKKRGGRRKLRGHVGRMKGWKCAVDEVILNLSAVEFIKVQWSIFFFNFFF